MNTRRLIGCLGLAGLAVLINGCSTLEVGSEAAAPDIKVLPPGDAVEHASPPSLPGEKMVENVEPAPPAKLTETLDLSLEQAIVMGLDHNQSLKVQEISPQVRQTAVATQRALFDPVFTADYTKSWDRLTRHLLVQTPVEIPGDTADATSSLTVLKPVDAKTKTNTDDGNVGLSEFLPTGTTVSVGYGPSRTTTHYSSTDPDVGNANNTDVNASSVAVTVTQNLLQGAGLGVNLAGLRQARLGVKASEYELRGFVEDLVSEIEQTYWDYVLAQRQIKIYEDSLDLAQSQADEVNERIRVGRVSETERAAAEAEVAQRKSSLINARSNLASVRLALLQLLNPGDDAMKTTDVRPLTEPVTPDVPLENVANSLELAMQMRPDLNQARLQIKSDDLELVKTRNGLLPQLDLFVSLGKNVNRTEYANAMLVSTRDVRDSRTTTQVGIKFDYPLGNRAARARHLGAQLAREQDREALANMTQLVEQDVRTAYVELRRAREQISATAATRKLQEETVQAETEKYRLGRSTVLLVAQAQRDLLSAQIGEVQAQTDFLKAIVNLYRLEGTLLERRGVVCPGQEPVSLQDSKQAARS